jgi:subtilisin family serine protease
VVAVIDTGVDRDHPFLAGRVLEGIDFVDGDTDPREERNGVDDDGDGDVDEGYGHGTFVAGLILAVAPDARILPIRVLNSDARGEAAHVAEAVVFAADAGAHVINLSLGTLDEARIVRDAIHTARERGVLVVVAAGNEADQIQFPARYGNTLAVTAVDATGVAADFTNLGSQADLAAPGVDLIGPMPTDAGAFWARWSGTSFAAPLVSGAAALVRAADPTLEADDTADRLTETAEDIRDLNPGLDGDLGEGLVRPDLAVRN